MAVFVDRTVQVPVEYVKNSEIVLNIGFEATSGLRLGNDQRFDRVGEKLGLATQASYRRRLDASFPVHRRCFFGETRR